MIFGAVPAILVQLRHMILNFLLFLLSRKWWRIIPLKQNPSRRLYFFFLLLHRLGYRICKTSSRLLRQGSTLWALIIFRRNRRSRWILWFKYRFQWNCIILLHSVKYFQSMANRNLHIYKMFISKLLYNFHIFNTVFNESIIVPFHSTFRKE